MPTIAINANTSWYLYNFRRSTITMLLEQGYQVIAIAPADEYTARLKGLGCDFIAANSLQAKSTNPFHDFKYLLFLVKCLASKKVDLILNFTIKPNVFGTLAAFRLGIPCINNVSGIGSSFLATGLKAALIRQLYCQSQRMAKHVFFQNEEDRFEFTRHYRSISKKSTRIAGSGVDVSQFTYEPKLIHDSSATFIFVGRLLIEKGLVDFIESARLYRKTNPQHRFLVLGGGKQGDPGVVDFDYLQYAQDRGWIEYCGQVDNVADYLTQADCVVLPSYYREGVPRSLLEAAACGRPIITTDNVGCREILNEGKNGFVCQKQSPKDLCCQYDRFMMLNNEQRLAFQVFNRQLAENEFNENAIIEIYLQRINEVIK